MIQIFGFSVARDMERNGTLHSVTEHSDSKNKYTEEDIIKMLEFLVDSIFLVFAGKVFQHISISILQTFRS